MIVYNSCFSGEEKLFIRKILPEAMLVLLILVIVLDK